jgi:hypothetical protein
MRSACDWNGRLIRFRASLPIFGRSEEEIGMGARRCRAGLGVRRHAAHRASRCATCGAVVREALQHHRPDSAARPGRHPMGDVDLETVLGIHLTPCIGARSSTEAAPHRRQLGNRLAAAAHGNGQPFSPAWFTPRYDVGGIRVADNDRHVARVHRVETSTIGDLGSVCSTTEPRTLAQQSSTGPASRRSHGACSWSSEKGTLAGPVRGASGRAWRPAVRITYRGKCGRWDALSDA